MNTPPVTPVFWMFAEEVIQEAVRVYILHLAYPQNYPDPPTPEQFEALKNYLINWLSCFEGLDSLKERLPRATTVAELDKIIRIMAEAGADPI